MKLKGHALVAAGLVSFFLVGLASAQWPTSSASPLVVSDRSGEQAQPKIAAVDGGGFYLIQQRPHSYFDRLIFGLICCGKCPLRQFHCSRILPPGKCAACRSKKTIRSQTVIARPQVHFGSILKRVCHFRIAFCLPQ